MQWVKKLEILVGVRRGTIVYAKASQLSDLLKSISTFNKILLQVEEYKKSKDDKLRLYVVGRNLAVLEDSKNGSYYSVDLDTGSLGREAGLSASIFKKVAEPYLDSGDNKFVIYYFAVQHKLNRMWFLRHDLDLIEAIQLLDKLVDRIEEILKQLDLRGYLIYTEFNLPSGRVEEIGSQVLRVETKPPLEFVINDKYCVCESIDIHFDVYGVNYIEFGSTLGGSFYNREQLNRMRIKFDDFVETIIRVV